MPFGISRLGLLRQMGERPVGKAQGTAEAPDEPALRHKAS
jgi:hypothetical protein